MTPTGRSRPPGRALAEPSRLWTAPLRALYGALSCGAEPRPADAIFVLAGQDDRKDYGLKLWHRGLAPVLILSVGRFEWRRFLARGLPKDGGLRALAGATPPARRHFFVTLDGAGARAERIERGRFGTQSEAAALARVVEERGYRSVLVVSTAGHLRRVALAVRRAIGDRAETSFTAVPEATSSIRRDTWWRSRAACAIVLAECLKLPVYALLPHRAARPARSRRSPPGPRSS